MCLDSLSFIHWLRPPLVAETKQYMVVICTISHHCPTAKSTPAGLCSACLGNLPDRFCPSSLSLIAACPVHTRATRAPGLIHFHFGLS